MIRDFSMTPLSSLSLRESHASQQQAVFDRRYFRLESRARIVVWCNETNARGTPLSFHSSPQYRPMVCAQQHHKILLIHPALLHDHAGFHNMDFYTRFSRKGFAMEIS